MLDIIGLFKQNKKIMNQVNTITQMNADAIRWDDPRLVGNRWMMSIVYEMFTDGYVVKRNVKIDGKKQYVSVLYDRSYVIAKLHNNIFSELAGCLLVSKEQIMSAAEEAWNRHWKQLFEVYYDEKVKQTFISLNISESDRLKIIQQKMRDEWEFKQSYVEELQAKYALLEHRLENNSIGFKQEIGKLMDTNKQWQDKFYQLRNKHEMDESMIEDLLEEINDYKTIIDKLKKDKQILTDELAESNYALKHESVELDSLKHQNEVLSQQQNEKDNFVSN